MSDDAQRVKCPSCGQVTGFHDIREDDLINFGKVRETVGERASRILSN